MKFLPWCLINGLKCTVQNILMSMNNLFELHITSKTVGGILVKPVPKKGKTITNETLHLVINFYEDDNFSRQVPGKKDYVSVSKGVHRQKLCNLQKFLKLARFQR